MSIRQRLGVRLDALIARFGRGIWQARQEFRHWGKESVHTSILVGQEVDRLRQELAQTQPKNPAAFGFGAYSQVDEDGIIQHILEKIAATTTLSKTCIEIGIGNGTENNTHYLLLQGYRGVWIEGDEKSVSYIGREIGGTTFSDFKIVNAFVTMQTLPTLLSDAATFLGTKDCDVYSLDVDGNDFYFAKETVKHINPKLFICEYNAKFWPPARVSIPYDPNHRWASDDYMGASLMCFVDALPGYKLVACNLTGANAFFVRNDLAGAFPDLPPEQLFQPFRPSLIWERTLHHPSTLKYLKARL